MDLAQLEAAIDAAGEPAFRVRQVWEWAARGVDDYAAMTNVPNALRERLALEVPFSTLTVVRSARVEGRHGQDAVQHGRRPSGRGRADALSRRETIGLRLVAVGLPADLHVLRDRLDAFGRNLTPGEILDQVLHFRRAIGASVDQPACSWAWASRC